jgi:general secretion pathway protein J
MKPRARRRESGFTLVEILVVMTLLSAVMLALGAAMRTIAQTEDRVDQRLQRSDEMRVATSFLSSTLGRISARKTQAPTQVGTSLFLFSGAQTAVMWVGVMPARYGAGGRYFFRLALERQGDRSDLVMRFVPWTGAEVFPNWATADSRVLVRSASRVSFEHAEEDGSTQSWLPSWPYPDKLPSRVRMSLQTPAVEWPQVVVALRQLPAADNGRGGFSLGPE